jgi:ABC-type microcin C transport system permease subunit YejE
MRITKKQRQRIARIGVWVFLVLFVLSITTGLVLLSRAQQAPVPVATSAP